MGEDRPQPPVQRVQVHASKGTITVSLHAEGDSVELEVRDTGSGIPREELPHIFERFHRVEGTRGRTQEGTGIGLALVRELVKLHGGEMSGESSRMSAAHSRHAIPAAHTHQPGCDRATGATIAPRQRVRLRMWKRRSGGSRSPSAQHTPRSRAMDREGRRFTGQEFCLRTTTPTCATMSRGCLREQHDVEAVGDGQSGARRLRSQGGPTWCSPTS